VKAFAKNSAKFKTKDILKYLKEFDELYKKRPIKSNIGGMQYPHMFATYYFLKKINPKFVVESGVYKGQSTWLIEKTCPNAKILSIDINLNNLKYKSKKATYSNIDFSKQNFSNIKQKTLIFFDDHQNALERFKQCKKYGFKNIIYEDNYASGLGDNYSFKKILDNAGNIRKITIKDIIKNMKKILKECLKKYFNQNYVPNIDVNQLIWNLKLDNISPNRKHRNFFLKNIDIYKEFPPIFKKEYNRWGELWDNKKYFTEKPILSDDYKEKFSTAYNEAKSYTWICYIKLK